MRPTLHIELLGRFHLIYGGAPVTVGSMPLQTLIAYLVLHSSKPQPRRQLAGLFEPSATEAQALSTLDELLRQLGAGATGREAVSAVRCPNRTVAA